MPLLAEEDPHVRGLPDGRKRPVRGQMAAAPRLDFPVKPISIGV